jgi:hypothetical protein
MRIDVWRTREKPPKKEPFKIDPNNHNFCTYCNHNLSNTIIPDNDSANGLMIFYHNYNIDRSNDYTLTKGDVFKLLKAILFSIKHKVDETVIIKSCCRDFCKDKIKIYKPQKIIVMGEKAKEVLFKKNTLKTDEGTQAMLFNIPVITTFHPEQLFLEPSLKKILWSQLNSLSDSDFDASI